MPVVTVDSRIRIQKDFGCTPIVFWRVLTALCCNTPIYPVPLYSRLCFGAAFAFMAGNVFCTDALLRFRGSAARDFFGLNLVINTEIMGLTVNSETIFSSKRALYAFLGFIVSSSFITASCCSIVIFLNSLTSDVSMSERFVPSISSFPVSRYWAVTPR